MNAEQAKQQYDILNEQLAVSIADQLALVATDTTVIAETDIPGEHDTKQIFGIDWQEMDANDEFILEGGNNVRLQGIYGESGEVWIVTNDDGWIRHEPLRNQHLLDMIHILYTLEH